jgi:hypothetical protein
VQVCGDGAIQCGELASALPRFRSKVGTQLSSTEVTVYKTLFNYRFKHARCNNMWFCYGCQTWSLTLREKHRLRVSENRVLRRIFGPKGNEMTGGWKKPHNELRNMYPSPRIIRMIKTRRMRLVGHVVRMRRRGMHIRYWWESQKRPLRRRIRR